ncbi:hypothetical protein D9M70_642390 [compost metagenome]
MFARKAEQVCLSFFRYVEESFRAFKAILLFEIFCPCSLARTKLPAIAPRSPIAEASSFNQDNVSSLLCQMISR